MELGFDVFIPHLTLFWHFINPRPVEFWYEYDLRILTRCDALFRISGESVGADKEVTRAKELSLPIIYGGDDVLTAMENFCWR